MAFIPQMFQDNFWAPNCPRRRTDSRYPVRNLTEDVLNSIAIAQAMFGPECVRNNQDSNINNNGQQQGSTVTIDKNKFQANFDVQHFRPEEIIVKVNVDKSVTIEAKHEEKRDDHGAIFRHFIRKYLLPDNCDIDKLESKLSSDGVLTITAPFMTKNAAEQRTIPITQTGAPVRSIENLRHGKDKANDEDVMEP